MTVKETRCRSCHQQELAYIRRATGLISDEGVRLRLQNLLFLSVQEAHHAKIKYMLVTVVTIVLATTIMVITSASTGIAIWASESFGTAANLIVAVLAGGINVAGTMLAVTKWREDWIRYRRCADRIEGELSLYLAQERPYQHSDGRDGRLMMRVERIATCVETSRDDTVSEETEDMPSVVDGRKEK